MGISVNSHITYRILYYVSCFTYHIIALSHYDMSHYNISHYDMSHYNISHYDISHYDVSHFNISLKIALNTITFFTYQL